MPLFRKLIASITRNLFRKKIKQRKRTKNKKKILFQKKKLFRRISRKKKSSATGRKGTGVKAKKQKKRKIPKKKVTRKKKIKRRKKTPLHKKRINRAKSARKPKPKRKNIPLTKDLPKGKKSTELSSKVLVGEVTHYFSRIEVCVIKMTRGTIRIGDLVRMEGKSTKLIQKIGSLQIENNDVKTAHQGQLVGLKVNGKVRPGDKVYRF